MTPLWWAQTPCSFQALYKIFRWTCSSIADVLGGSHFAKRCCHGNVRRRSVNGQLDCLPFGNVEPEVVTTHPSHPVWASAWAETWRRVWGDGNKFRGPHFQMTFFRKKWPF